MITLTDLKRKLQIGQGLILIGFKTPFEANNKRLNVVRYVVKIQTNGVHLNEDKTANKGSFLEFPKASLLDITEKGFKIFTAGLRDLTPEEKEIKANEPKDEEQEKNDLMTDGSTMFYRRMRYYKEKDAEYLQGHSKVIRGLHFDYNTNKIRDYSIKGELSLEYEFV